MKHPGATRDGAASETGPDDYVIRVIDDPATMDMAAWDALLAMQPSGTTDVWRLSWRLATIRKLDAARVIAQGQRGWVDARLTDLGIQVRQDLAQAH